MRANLYTFRGILSESAALNGNTLSVETAAVKAAVTTRYNALCKQGKAFALYQEIEKAINARIDTAAGRQDMAAAFASMKEGEAVAFRGRFSERTGKSLFIRTTPLPIFPGGEDFIKGLAKKAVKKGCFCTLKKVNGNTYTQTVYEIYARVDGEIRANKVSCTVLRGATDAAYISGVKAALSGVSFR